MSAEGPLRLPARPQRPGLGSVPAARQGVLFGLVLLVLLALAPALISPTRAAGLAELSGKAVRRTLERPRSWREGTGRLAGFYRGELARGSASGMRLTQLVGGLLAGLALALAVLGPAARDTATRSGAVATAPTNDTPLRLSEAGPLRVRAALQPEPQEAAL